MNISNTPKCENCEHLLFYNNQLMPSSNCNFCKIVNEEGEVIKYENFIQKNVPCYTWFSGETKPVRSGDYLVHLILGDEHFDFYTTGEYDAEYDSWFFQCVDNLQPSMPEKPDSWLRFEKPNAWILYSKGKQAPKGV